MNALDSIENVTIKNNTFVVVGGEIKSVAIQVANVDADSIKIEDNKFEAAYAALRIHETYAGEGSEISFGGNTVQEGALTVVGDETDYSNTVAEALAARFE